MGTLPADILASFVQLILRNWALSATLAGVVIIVLVYALVIARYVRITTNILQEAPLPLSMKLRDFRPMAGEDVEFWAADGLRLRGTIIPRADKRQPPRGLIVFAPEYKNSRDTVARYCRALCDAGYDLFTFDFRNQGESAEEPRYTPRQWASDREVADATGAFVFAEEWLRSQGRPIEYGLFGISRGAGAGILAAAQRPTVRAIVTDSAFSADRVMEHYIRRYAEVFIAHEVLYTYHPREFWRFLRWWVFSAFRWKYDCWFPSVQKAIARMIPRPMLLIHGGRDSYISEQQSRLLYAVAPQPRFLWIVPRAKHNQSVVVEPDEYARRTVDFFDLYLARQPRPGNWYGSTSWSELASDDSGVAPPPPRSPEPAHV